MATDFHYAIAAAYTFHYYYATELSCYGCRLRQYAYAGYATILLLRYGYAIISRALRVVGCHYAKI